METKESPFSSLLSFSRLIDLTGNGVSRQIIGDYAVREINFLLWFACIVFTTLLLKKLVNSFDLWQKGYRISGRPRPSLDGHFKLFARYNPQIDLNGKYQ